ncbi:hypothetical protein L2E82_46926 [Cichorium intybus]|uniref:Uncharacterized protein n=1 Tax=Cichorium intybus TaxID=13427 RepID=A0ACB8YV74_CICIN|nr:hypothetical protein L2E82_46926 [Cichorium intybus]
MESFPLSSSHIYLNQTNPVSLRFHLSSINPSILSFPHRYTTISALKTSRGDINPQQGGAAYSAADLLRKPAVEVKVKDFGRGFSKGESEFEDDGGIGRGEESWVDWEDRILEDTVPLVGFVRMILHSGKYEIGERLSSEHENIILHRLLAHHPESEKKIGCGIDYIMVGNHPDFESSRCLFIVRTNGEIVDFSYWKCVKAFIKKKYPLQADSFILQHFRKRKRYD